MRKGLLFFVLAFALLGLAACASPVTENVAKSTVAPTQQIKTIEIGQVLNTSKCDIVVKKIEFSYDVLPDNTSGFYTHYEADSGKVYMHIDTDVKNTQKQNLPCDEILTATADYNNVYSYAGFSVVEEANLGFTYASISKIHPLETKGIRFLIECPDEVATSSNVLEVKLVIDGEAYYYRMR